MVDTPLEGICLAQAKKSATFKDYSMKAISYCGLFTQLVVCQKS